MPEVGPPAESKHVPLLGLVVLVGVVAIAGAFFFFLRGDFGGSVTGSPTYLDYDFENTPVAVLQRDNTSFNEATRLFDLRDFAGARAAYERALGSARNDVETGQIEYKIALTEEMLGNYEEAIRRFKAVAARETYTPSVRAYAVQRLGLIYYTYGVVQEGIHEEIFTGEPYASFLVPDDIARSYVNLFEYASLFRPLAYGESRIAAWYAGRLQMRLEEGTLSKEEGEEYARKIQAHVRNAQADLPLIQNDPNARGDVPMVLIRLGMALGSLSLINMDSIQNADRLVRQGYDMAIALGTGPVGDGYARYNYANFLVQFFPGARDTEVQAILAPIAAGSIYSGTVFEGFLASRRNTSDSSHDSLVKMANAAPRFKEYLRSLGWSDAQLAE